MDQVGQGLGALGALFFTAVVFAFFFLFFLIVRKIMLWYWKIEEAISHLKKIGDTLENLEKLFVQRLAMQTQALDAVKRLDQKAANLEEDDHDAKA